jgi:hypothetical protein
MKEIYQNYLFIESDIDHLLIMTILLKSDFYPWKEHVDKKTTADVVPTIAQKKKQVPRLPIDVEPATF